MTEQFIIALDGHDGAGKTTLATELAKHLHGISIRPFAGSAGSKLIEAGKSRNIKKLIRIGSDSITEAILATPKNTPIVLDRGWMTVASLAPDLEFFFSNWHIWVPTVLCWTNLETTLSRLSLRHNEASYSIPWHRHYLNVYKKLAKRSNSFILRTDQMDQQTCINQLEAWSKEISNKLT
jgi:hypothetical protein